MTGEVKAQTPLIAKIASDKVLCYISMALLTALPVVELFTEILKSSRHSGRGILLFTSLMS